MKNTIDYNQQAIDFLTATGVTISIVFDRHGKHFEGDTQERDIYNVTIRRGTRSFSFKFGASINDSGIVYIGNNPKPTGATLFNHNGYHCVSAHYAKQLFNKASTKVLAKRSEPTAYDILTCLTKYDPGNFENFCNEFGYDTDSRKAEKTYKAVCEEYKNVCTVWNDAELEQLQEIQ